MNNTEAIIKPSYDAKLTNQDLAPLKKQTWGAYNIFAFWMSDVHSVGGYVYGWEPFCTRAEQLAGTFIFTHRHCHSSVFYKSDCQV
ncbi:hypothetical protein ACLFLN_17770 [Acinetobacter pittii]